tara:strand:+ start:36 stop:1247 length:1212 start_codon:yes stop_codon:yes gene_type:complete
MPRRASPDYNFALSHPELLDEWDYSKNHKKPEEYTPSSGQKVWWICRVCTHNWESKIDNRVKPRGCPNCDGKKPHSDGHNSLASLRPELVLDWNDVREPEEFRIGSHYRAKWKCHKCEHQWYTSISKRAELGRRCLSCTGQQAHSSGIDSVKTKHPELMDEWNDDRDPMKFLPGSSVMIEWKCRNCSHEWPMSIKNRTPGNQGGRGCTYCNGPGGKSSRVVHSDGRNSMSRKFPRLAKELHPTMNDEIQPDSIIGGTNKKLWWICNSISKDPCGYIWLATGNKRVPPLERGCPRCAVSGFKPDEPGYLYCLEFDGPLGKFWKVGITSNIKRRISQIRKSIKDTKFYHDYEINVYGYKYFDKGLEAQQEEKKFLENKDIRFIPVESFSGSTELFNCIPEDLLSG